MGLLVKETVAYFKANLAEGQYCSRELKRKFLDGMIVFSMSGSCHKLVFMKNVKLWEEVNFFTLKPEK